MTRRIPNLTAALMGLGVIAASAGARAQPADVNPPLPNVMLLVDTSGSMEYKSGGGLPTCIPTGNGSERSRWIEAVEVLTGSIADYRCDTVNRSTAAFRNEYSLGTTVPADYQSKMPYHRPLSGTCTPGPGVLPSPNAFDYPSGAIRYHAFDNFSSTCTTFSQANDGILDNFLTLFRFGLMTFDTASDSGTGVAGTAPNYATGIRGTWSYFVGSAKMGHPAACTTSSDQEVGARNAGAPPWEGRMVAFGDPAANTAATVGKNQQIQEILLSTRPYDATPTAGMLDDARAFFWYDNSADPLNSALKFGPVTDSFVLNGCREQSIILLTDGEPNLDLRRHPGDGLTTAQTCEGAGPPAGICPYDKPEDIAFSLANPSGSFPRVTTYVIGFALSTVTVNSAAVDCKALTDADLTQPGGLCLQNPDNVPLQACCSLNRIAFSGGTGRAYFVSDKASLREAVSSALSKKMVGTSRTYPVFAAGGAVQNSADFAASFRIFSSFKPQTNPWSGVLERQRLTCVRDVNTGIRTPTPQRIDPTKGDNFVVNVNSGAGPARTFVSVTGEIDNGAIHSERSIRPQLTSDVDGLGLYTGTQYSGSNVAFVQSTPAAAMSLVDDSCGAGLTALQCRDLILRWDVGLDNGTEHQRCRAPGTDCNLIGDIYHSTPRVVNRPLNIVRDEGYATFTAAHQKRPMVLYTSTNDGFLHAFKVARNDPTDTEVSTGPANNELWAFVPPAVLPSIQSQYPPSHANLLDGVPVVQDVIARPVGSSFVLDRTLTAARNGTGTYRTVLVQGFGRLRAGYFALDITNPVPDQSGNGPKFLWQLTTDTANAPLFGASGVTPLITSVFFDIGGGDVREVAVAVLPGGSGGSPTGASCARAQTSYGNIDSAYLPRSSVNCYAGANIGGRSLTIVRLDTGEVIRTFRRSAADAPAGLSSRVTVANIDSPITGEPVAFPAGTGVIADRIYVGDADGALWKVNLASTDPADWTMDLFFDAYPTSQLHVYNSGQPIDTPPVVSIDEFGNATLAVLTGDQEVFANGTTNYVWSLTDKPNSTGTALETKVNWYKKYDNGERVAGPMSLFNGSLFFSTFRPASTGAGACTVGTSTLWGMHYLRRAAETVFSNGGAPALPDTSTVATGDTVLSRLMPANVSIFGVGVAQLPTCSETDTASSDFLGYGSHTSITNVNPGKFQLVVQTGSVGTAVEGGETKMLTIDLESPALVANIDSWAAVVE